MEENSFYCTISVHKIPSIKLNGYETLFNITRTISSREDSNSLRRMNRILTTWSKVLNYVLKRCRVLLTHNNHVNISL